jgi:hypothetical protein
MLLLALLLATADARAEAILANRQIVGCFARVLADGSGPRPESAAFVVLRGGANFDCVPWPRTNDRHSARFNGRIPAGTVAIVHSHPASQPEPSPHDLNEAQRLGISIFVVTPDAVTMAPAGGPAATVTRDRDWWR